MSGRAIAGLGKLIQPPTTVIAMKSVDSLSLPGAKFDRFLFASIGEENNGLMLSVVSALARSNFDPWIEADNLAHLPEKAAIQRLALLIPELPAGPLPSASPECVAARLISLLPGRLGSPSRPRDALLSAEIAEKSEATPHLVFLAGALAVLFVFSVASLPENIEKKPASASTSALAPHPTPGVGQ